MVVNSLNAYYGLETNVVSAVSYSWSKVVDVTAVQSI